ncbi:class I SAM-dependent methyltransferase [Paenibacillus flagellatus]|uniref:16S rRNA (Cytosine(1402)-N(4))-methyltransferase n=1 Tax=Paenibacillus flagellatus TaxID=2211139 RepID=A0A2V5KFW4_9BACL|nr:class I SAM-dependent methyltransferase [Paenibacillus flagellatus]PYI53010.1 16S rRNA (cytosine(1402)-N(4))-methyltransferase [Paenibacillus flagellatus]
MGFLSVLSFAHRCVADRIRPGDAAIDATVGTGADTAFLCKAVGPQGAVFAFDIQAEALARARERIAALPDAPKRLQLLLRSHAEMREAIPEELHGRIAAVMFNLGYLPGGDERIITRPESTIPALQTAISLLKPDGVLTVVLYPGHEGGGEEAERVERWAESLPETEYRTVVYRFANRSGHPPYVIAVERKKKPTVRAAHPFPDGHESEGTDE